MKIGKWTATKSATVMAAAALGGSAACGAAELPDCHLDSNGIISRVLESSRTASGTDNFLEVKGNLRNGTPVTYAKDDAVIVADIRVTHTTPTVTPSGDLLLKSSWMLSPSYRFRGGKAITTQRQLELEGGARFSVAMLQDGSVLFVDSEGRFCNKALNTHIAPPVWIAGTLSQEPAEVTLENKITEEERGQGSIRVIFNGVTAGVLSFQEVWVKGPTVLKSQTRNFDQFAKEVEVGPFKFQVVAVADGKVTLRYDIPDRMPADLRTLASVQVRSR